ncbi:MAG: T9SS type A sorting domain-containing protein, partial [Chitinophagales bacterium]
KNTCTAISDPIAITVNTNPTPTISADGSTTFCDGGDVTLTSSTAVSYLWSDGSTGASVLADASGSYSVTVTDANGCSGTSGTTTVTENANPVASITAGGPTTFCEGGSVTLTSNAASSYLWSTGETSAAISADASGDYTVTVTDANGCMATSPATTVTVNANPVASISADGPTSFCDGGSVNLTASAGSSYLWSTGETTATINVSASGDYSCTVTNAAGCSDESDVTTVSVTTCGSVSISADGPTEFCDGGSVMLTSTEPTGNVWNTGETTQSIVVTTSGDYSCVNGVNTSNTISVNVKPNPDATISADGATEFCEGGSVNINAVAGYDSYLWSDGSTGSSVNVSASGSYSVMVTDDGCTSSSSNIDVTVNSNPTPTISADGPTTFCAGSVNLSVDGSYSSYAWSTGETTASINVSSSGSYSVTVTDANGCSGTSNTIEVTEGSAPTISISTTGDAVLCYEGSVELTATASAGNLQWYNDGVLLAGETGTTYTAVSGGKYTCVATDGGCSATSNMINVKPAKKIIMSPAGPYTLCPGSTTVTLSVAMYPTATYQWYKGAVMLVGETANTYTATAGGKYHCIVTKDGCQRITKNAVITESCRTMEVAEDNFSIYPNPAMEYAVVKVASSEDQVVMLTISDISGKVFVQDQVSVLHGLNSIEIDTELIPSGFYTVSLTNAANITSVQKLVIEK